MDRRKRMLSLFIGIVAVGTVFSQCSNFNSNYPTGTFSTTGTNWIVVDYCVYGGDYQSYFVVEGGYYQWASCYGTGFDSEITLWDESHTNVLAYSSDDCSTFHGNIAWTATFTGNVHLLLSEETCQTNETCHRMYWRMLSPPPPPANDDACSATELTLNSTCDFATETNAGATDSGVDAPSCGSYSGGDIWYSFTAPLSGNVTISTRDGSITDMVMAAYEGSCSSLNEIACNDDAVGYMPELELTGLTPGEIIYIQLFTYGNAQSGDFELCAYEPCSAAPINDLMCSAQELTIGTAVFGDNNCAGSTGVPNVPNCWSNGTVNSTWYQFDAPVGGAVKIRVEPTSLAASQVALFTGSCALNSTVACAQGAGEGCGSTGTSDLYVDGLNPGSTYYIMVDGVEDLTGQYHVSVSDMAGVSAQTGSDCSSAIPICNDNFSVADPGPQGTGNYCDFNAEGNCTGGERNSLWYQIDVGATGDLLFTLTPNDGNPTSCGSETDYDFVLWKISGSGETTDCGTMATDASQGLLACNYSGLGVTGISDTGDRPGGYSNCFNESFEQAVSVNEGDVLLLVIQNYEGSTNGFSIDFSDSDNGVVPSTNPSTLYWSGGSSDNWDDQGNWGGCGVTPSCNVDVVIPSSAGNFPRLTDDHYVKSLTIEDGASLELVSGGTLNLCGDLNSYGTLDASKNSTIFFNNATGTQNLEGDLTGDNAIGNLTINKMSGSVQLNSTLEVQGDFLTQSPTSKFNTNGNAVYLGGNFRNNDGAQTFRGTSTTGTLIFNGDAEQTYAQGSSTLNLNHVVIDNSGAGISLLSDLRIKNNTGSLTLTNGVVKTDVHDVFFRNPDHTALNEGNPNSYIEGTLIRYINPTGLYHLPVGSATTGYQRADVDFHDNSITYLTVIHSPWVSNPGSLMEAECMTLYDLDALDNGYFTITANTNATSAEYDITLFNQSYTNVGTASGWTVMKDSGAGWMLDGQCEVSRADTVYRTGLTGFSKFATAQASNPLPIELLSFDGEPLEEGNLIRWVTASEVNNDYFTLESCTNGRDFEELTTLPGAGFSSGEMYYDFIDLHASNGFTYYRLKQTDYDGTYTYSDLIVVERKDHFLTEASWPNPVRDYMHLRMSDLGSRASGLTILDITGKVITTADDWSVLRDDVIIIRDTQYLNPGIYFIEVLDRQGASILHRRFAKD
ncbi:MAG: hypothetical protein HKN79_08120 [Flavobacteriales bacterium]|nr:hypothetical protein [Flavobacteriales bacterium]